MTNTKSPGNLEHDETALSAALENMLPGASIRRALYGEAVDGLEHFIETLRSTRVAPTLDAIRLRERLSDYDYEQPRDPTAVIRDTIDLLEKGTVHVASPRYFGLFNPTPAFLGAIADLITAIINPQLAVWSHASTSVEIERNLIRFFGERFGLPGEQVAGSFTSGGAEANLTALLLALTRAFPDYAEDGLRALPGDPVFYASSDSHLAWLKIAHACGIGRSAMRLVQADEQGRLDPETLSRAIAQDRANGRAPFMIVATAGTTGAGSIDPLPVIANIAGREELHFHVDAAWGGAAILSDRLAPELSGTERASSITVDAHKWLAAPMGAGMFICTDNDGLYETFRVAASYMPPGGEADLDPYTHSIQWSRRFSGLKLFLPLAVLGRPGYAAIIDAEAQLAAYLRQRLAATGWRVVNNTPLPLVCFVDTGGTDVASIAQAVVDGGTAWISTTMFGGRPVLRACNTSFRSTRDDVEALIDCLDKVRTGVVTRGG